MRYVEKSLSRLLLMAGLCASAQAYGYFASGFEPGELPPPSMPLNDTGVQFCGEGTGGNIDPCTGTEPLGQDADYGRDALAATGELNKLGGGNAGFDYTKISNTGNPLPAGATLGIGPDDWACTRDNVTGLIWEVKVSDSAHLRYQYRYYAWYDPDSADGNPGSEGSTTSCGNSLGGLPCNTHNFTAAVNAQGLCGATDWRMPTRHELQGIVDFGHFNPAIDSGFFPKTSGYDYWSSTLGAEYPDQAWVIHFREGHAFDGSRASGNHVRLVRDGQ